MHWADFETLIDLLLSRGGWHRVSSLGGNMKDADIVVEQAVPKEMAFVQVKSAAGPRDIDDHVAIFDKNGVWNCMIFACHSPKGTLKSDRPEVVIWARAELAEMVFRNGLFDWLLDRVA